MQAHHLFLCVFVAAGVTGALANAGEPAATTIPAGTRLTFHVDAPMSSNESTTGQSFSFELEQPIVLANGSIPVAGTTGFGTIYLAGRAGTSGHEGDLTLRLDRLTTEDGRTYAFDDQRFSIDGRNREAGSTAPIETVLLRPANVSGDLVHF